MREPKSIAEILREMAADPNDKTGQALLTCPSFIEKLSPNASELLSIDKSSHVFSFFKLPVENTTPFRTITLRDAYTYIAGPWAKTSTGLLRAQKTAEQASKFKRSNFSYCTFSGVFEKRNAKNLLWHSGLICFDFDHLGDVEGFRAKLLADEYFDTQLLFVSPSGDGLKWVIAKNDHTVSHSEYFQAVANYISHTYGVVVDKSGSDVSRACFLPHDPNVYIHPKHIKNYEQEAI
jgi:hypothetical protein